MTAKKYPPALPHLDLEEIFPDIFFVTGTMAMGRLFRFSRNMIVVRQGEELTVINTVRLDDEGLDRLDALGTVRHVIKLGFFHDRDDAFYVDRYKARFWALPGHTHAPGLEADVEMDDSTGLPIEGASLFFFKSTARPEAILRLDHEGGILVSCDALQNWARAGFGFNFFAKMMMKMMGFIKPANVGPGWIRYTKPQAADFERLKKLEYRHALGAHGEPLKDTAKEQYEATFQRLFGV